MPVVIVPGTPHATEVCKWEYSDFRLGDEQGQRGPRTYQEYPMRLYKGGRNAQNQVDLVDSRVADDESQRRRLEADGYQFGPEKAIAVYEAHERELAKLEANLNHQVRSMGEKAQAEANAVIDDAPDHIGEIPETPIKRRGRPKKVSV